MDNVVPLKPRRQTPDALLTCVCGERWFHAVVTFRQLPGGFHKPDGYRMADESNQPAVVCVACGRRIMVT